MDNEISFEELNRELDKYNLMLPCFDNYSDLKQQLSLTINSLINDNFSRLVALLYSLDINEKKLKDALRNSGKTTAGEIISELIIKRQLQKIHSRKAFQKEDNIPDDEKW